MRGVRHRLVRKSIPKGLVFVGELPYGSNGGFSPKMDHLVCQYVNILVAIFLGEI
jgi:endoplasmic reticulum Man9GlcNAc2 1,2-alpha-mannosidase